MTIDCPHWRDIGLRGAGECNPGKFRGKPSHGTCAVCLGIAPAPAAGVTALSTILTEDQQQRVRERKAICATCDRAKGFTQLTVRCDGCGCVGLSLLNGRCPLGKWPARRINT